jgi:hypothetical protein
MKNRKRILTVAVVLFTAVIFCLPVIVMSGKSPNPPIVADNEKVNGGKQGVIIAVYKPSYEHYENGPQVPDTVTAVLRIDGHVYYRELPSFVEGDFTPPNDPDDPDDPEKMEEWYNTAALSIAGIALPNEILDDFGMESCFRAQILTTSYFDKDGNEITITKDVNNLIFEKLCLNSFDQDCIDYVRVLNCDVKVSFICPK